MIKSVTLLINEIGKFIKSDFHLASYLFTFVFIALCIYFNYTLHFYVNYIRQSYYTGNSTWVLPLFYVSMYFFIAISTLVLRKDFKALKNKAFYLKSLFIICIYGISIGFYSYKSLHFPNFFEEENLFIIRIISQLKSLVFYLIPLYILKLIFDKNIKGLYGLTLSSQHIRGYFILFLALLPFIIIVSFTPDFQLAYPQFKPWLYTDILGLKTWQTTAIFQISYAIDFVMTELLFRGALVIGMVSILGRNAILPMVTMYVAIHYGKPLGETISSIFGGYILGALAYQTRHIWGGVIVHISIALSMELAAILQHYTK